MIDTADHLPKQNGSAHLAFFRKPLRLHWTFFVEIHQLDQHDLGCGFKTLISKIVSNIMSLIIPPILPEIGGLYIDDRMRGFGFEVNAGYLNIFCLIPPQYQFAGDQSHYFTTQRCGTKPGFLVLYLSQSETCVPESFCKSLHLATRQVPLPIAVFNEGTYGNRWDTLPQRRAIICEDTSDGYD